MTLLIVQIVWPVLYPSVSQFAPLNPHCDLRARSCGSRCDGGGRVRFGTELQTLG
ncbi:MAG: hypothetical protein ACUVQI_00850 [Thermochromatium sp.]